MQAVENIEVARALSHIRKNYPNANLQVSDIVDATEISRRPLEIAFKREVGRSIHHEIIRHRIEKAKELLTHSQESVGEIAITSGFGRVNQFHRTFRMHAGQTPRKFRQRLSKDKP